MSDQNWILYEKGETAFKLLMARPVADALDMTTQQLWEELKPVADSVSFSLWDAAKGMVSDILVTSVPQVHFLPNAS